MSYVASESPVVVSSISVTKTTVTIAIPGSSYERNEMKIALLGAPGSGKTKLARAIAKKLDGCTVVDNYVQKLQKQIGAPFGPNSSFPAEIEVLGARWTAEDSVKTEHSVTCGTLYESIIYASSITPWSVGEQTLIEDQIYVQTMMSAFGALGIKTYDYHALFYLPWENRESDHSWDAVVNAKIPEVLAGFGLAYVTLTGTNKQKVERVTELITPLITSPTEDEQPTV